MANYVPLLNLTQVRQIRMESLLVKNYVSEMSEARAPKNVLTLRFDYICEEPLKIVRSYITPLEEDELDVRRAFFRDFWSRNKLQNKPRWVSS